MVKLLRTQNPDDGTSLPVVVDSSEVEIAAIKLFRANVEGNPQALNADVSFGASAELGQGGHDRLLDVFLFVLTDGHVATMRDSMVVKAASDLQKPWDMATVSAGSGPIRAVFVKTLLHPAGTF